MDVYITDKVVRAAETFLPLRQLKVHSTLLEVSCHGVLWIAMWLAFIWLISNKDLYQMQVNFLLGILIDIAFVAILKAAVQRRRPSVNTDPFSIGPDKYSFPSGHASRVAFIVYFFLHLWTVPLIFVPPLFAWSFSVSVSRLLMRRHYLLDITAGIALGIFEGILLSYLYLERETCINFIAWLTDEKQEGGEFHV